MSSERKIKKNDAVTQKGTNHAFMSSVKIWYELVKRLRGYPGADDDTPVSAVWKNGRIQHVTSEDMITALRAAAKAIGEDKLGFKISEIGTHSLRSALRRSNGDDTVPSPGLLHNDDRLLVQRRFPEMHKKTSKAIQLECSTENDQKSHVQTHPRNRTKDLPSKPPPKKPP